MAVGEKEETKKNAAVAFVNWNIQDGALKSSRGFTLFDNTHTTKSDRALIALAKKHGGSVKVMAELNIVLNTTADVDELDLDSIEIITE